MKITFTQILKDYRFYQKSTHVYRSTVHGGFLEIYTVGRHYILRTEDFISHTVNISEYSTVSELHEAIITHTSY